MLLTLSAVPLKAQENAYVVKADSNTIYIDISQYKTPLFAGEVFTVAEDGEELFSPVTKESLGKVSVFIASGTLTDIQPKFAEGKITGLAAMPKAGQKVAFTQAPQTAVQTPADAKPAEEKVLWASQQLDGQIISIALGDTDGDGKKELVGADEQGFKIYTVKDGKLSEKAAVKLPDLQRLVSVETGNLGWQGADKVFATYYDNFRKELHTHVYTCTATACSEETTVKWLVKGFTGKDGKRRIFAQEMFTAQQEPSFSTVKPLVWENGTYSVGDKLRNRRLDWLYGFTLTDLDGNGSEDLLYTTTSGKISVQFEKKSAHWETDNTYGRTPVRLKLGDTIVKFYSRLVLREKDGKLDVYAISNTHRSGIMSETFGRYQDGNMVTLHWNGSTLDNSGSLLLHGYTCDIDNGSLANLPDGVIAASVNLNDKSIIRVLGY